MKGYKYVIIDDDDMDRLAISFYLKNYSFLEHCATFSSSEEGLDYIKKNKIDIVFLDIDMPFMNGIEVQKKIRNEVSCTIFVTSYTEFAVEGFELDAFDYITKPFTPPRIEASVKKAKEYLDLIHKGELFDMSFKNESILVKEGYSYVGLLVYEIVYLEALKDYTKLVSLYKTSTTIHCNLGAMLKREHFENFIRIHKSFAIQRNYIQEIKSNHIVLINDIVLPIGLNYKKDLIYTLS